MSDVITQLGDLLQTEANEKVKEAMQLFIRVDDDMKRVVLFGSGFKGEVTAQRLRDHFDTMELLDELDSAIEDMQWDLDNKD